MNTPNSSPSTNGQDAPAAPTTPTTPAAEAKKPKLSKKASMTIATIGFIVVAIAAFFYWFLVLRFQESTNDAYVQGMQVSVMAQTSGNVTEVYFDNTDLVHAGDILVKLDDTNAKLAFETAKTDLATAVRQVQMLYQQNMAYKLEINESQVNLTQTKNDYEHRLKLNQTGAISLETLQHSKDAYDLARAELAVAEQNLHTNEAQLLKTDPSKQPAITAAANAVKDAWITLSRTEIRTPVTGYVARRSVQIGSEVSPSTPLLAIVPTKPMWVDANFKETQLKSIRIGQPATMTSDFYGSDIVFTGTVTGLDMGTGSAFSLLPAQNATGNWIKVVQRLPVRIDLDTKSQQLLDKYPLRIGLSMNVVIDIKDTSGAVLEATKRTEPAFKSDVLIPNLTEVETLIQNIINENSYQSDAVIKEKEAEIQALYQQ